MGEIKFTNSLLMAALFAVCIIAFTVGFAYDNDSAITTADDTDFSTTQTNIQNDIISFNSSVHDAGTSFNEDNVQQGTDTATSGGQFKKPMGSIAGIATSTMLTSFNKIFGSDFAFLGITLLGAITFIALRYAYKTWFGKDPD